MNKHSKVLMIFNCLILFLLPTDELFKRIIRLYFQARLLASEQRLYNFGSSRKLRFLLIIGVSTNLTKLLITDCSGQVGRFIICKITKRE